MARIDDEIQNVRRGAGNLLDAWEQVRGAERYLRFNGKIENDANGNCIPTALFTANDFKGDNVQATPQAICDVINAMDHVEDILTEAGFQPFYILRS